MPTKTTRLEALLVELQAAVSDEGLPPAIRSEVGRLAQAVDDALYEERHGRARWCRCEGHDGRYDRHEADRQRLIEEQRRLDAEREAARRAMEGDRVDEARIGWV